MKGIILAGGKGTRLFPITKIISKHLLPIYNKPMIYYSLSILMLANIKEILLISDEDNIKLYQNLLGDGSHLGLTIEYAEQRAPNGIAEAFIIAEKFINGDNVTLILGDNIFFGHTFPSLLEEASNDNVGGTVFGYHVNNPNQFGVVEINSCGEILSITEKPQNPNSNIAVTGLYIYDNDVVNIAKNLKPSKRGELEITDINKHYLSQKRLKIKVLGRGFAWLDTGTPESLLEASLFVETLEKRQSLKIACIEEIAFNKGFISKQQLKKLANNHIDNEYGSYLKRISQ
ncbi:Glucose-1-phosphate thymidylyltransferase 1 [Bacillus sp. THAF10]|uniref:glucose-1-phosphate thymidylyltransferase RfbA n=1 Tax=Bacillus sp. THAF10 TaxID=2587848 RepID=UPI001268F28F|nr:glucose-1-phosphate thymidylyltransferase RfbA [Bacillus sp. THAF10]QFT88416.1 Glucose-1-phosphate thymidylyltransferase 1 [Bacillus sp. THAF10]